MLRPRLIPCLLIHNHGLVKTIKFKDPKYVGDPLNAVRIFNEKEVDELMVLDIDATSQGSEPDYRLIQNLASECRMPLCYGGGIKSADEAQYIFSLGVEKIALSASAIDSPELITEIAERVGNQSVAVVLDVKKKLLGHKYELYTHNGKKSRDIDPVVFAKRCEVLGAGEIIVNSIDRDGTMGDYDHILIGKIRDAISIPMTVLGGAGSLSDVGTLLENHGIIGAAAGSLFVFKGKYKAVLINYPNPTEKEQLLQKYHN
jgi:imidazole glycerol-phosphate synthase subunit HisF